jgi:hypothetical protein
MNDGNNHNEEIKHGNAMKYCAVFFVHGREEVVKILGV